MAYISYNFSGANPIVFCENVYSYMRWKMLGEKEYITNQKKHFARVGEMAVIAHLDLARKNVDPFECTIVIVRWDNFLLMAHNHELLSQNDQCYHGDTKLNLQYGKYCEYLNGQYKHP